MALIKCPECGKEVSSSAKNCPNCGCPIEGRNEAVIRLDSLRVGQIAKVYVDGLQITETSSGSIVTIPVPNGRCNVVFETGGVLAKRSPVFTVEGGKKYQAVWETLQTIKAIVALNEVDQFSASNNPPSGGSSGCYVATAVYGSYDCPEVWTLRRFRDCTLAETWYGRAFIRTYYAISPTLVNWFGHTNWFKKLWKGKLDRLVSKLQSDGVESTPYEDSVW